MGRNNMDTRSRRRTGLWILLISIGLITGISGQSDNKEDEDCTAMNSMMRLLQKNVLQLSLCATELNHVSPVAALTSSNYLCVVKCALTKINILTPEGTVNMTGALDFMQNIPPSMREKSGGAFAKCGEFIAQIVPNDESCQSYEPLVKCGLKVIVSSLGSAIPGGGIVGRLGGVAGDGTGGGLGDMLGGVIGGGSQGGLGGILGGGSGDGLGGILGGGSGGGLSGILGGRSGGGLVGRLGGILGGGPGGRSGGGLVGRLGGILGGRSGGGLGDILGGGSGGGSEGGLAGKLGGSGGDGPLSMLKCVRLAGNVQELLGDLNINTLRRIF